MRAAGDGVAITFNRAPFVSTSVSFPLLLSMSVPISRSGPNACFDRKSRGGVALLVAHSFPVSLIRPNFRIWELLDLPPDRAIELKMGLRLVATLSSEARTSNGSMSVCSSHVG